MSPKILSLLLVVGCAATAIACGANGSSSSTPATPTPSVSTGTSTGTTSTCRTYATAATEVSTAVTGAMLTGAFNSSTRQFTATVVYPNGAVCTTAVVSYLSIADFVDEVKVIPGLTLAPTSTTTVGPACGSTGTSTITNSFDAQRRLTQVAQGGSTILYSAWDSAGRPTTGTASSSVISNTYDDTTRTLITTQSATVTTLTYDANGILLKQVDKTGSTVGTTTWTITSTDKVCK